MKKEDKKWLKEPYNDVNIYFLVLPPFWWLITVWESK